MKTVLIIICAMILCGALPLVGVWLGARIAGRKDRTGVDIYAPDHD